METFLAHTLSWLHETKKSFAFQNNSVLIVSVTSLPAQGLWRKKPAEYLLFIEGSLCAKLCATCFTFIVLSGLLGAYCENVTDERCSENEHKSLEQRQLQTLGCRTPLLITSTGTLAHQAAPRPSANSLFKRSNNVSLYV